MKLIQGSVAVQETGAGVAGVTVVVFARGDEGASVRVGSVATDARGEFRLEVDGAKFVWDLRLEIQATAPKPTVIYADAEARVGAGDVETWTIRIPTATLTSAGLLRPPSAIARELPALGSVIARTLANQDYAKEIRDTVAAHLDPKRGTAAQLRDKLRGELVARGRGGAVVIEPLLYGDVRDGSRTAIDLLAAMCRTPRALAPVAPPASPPAPPPAPPTIDDLAGAVWAELHPAVVDLGERADGKVPLIRQRDGFAAWERLADAYVAFVDARSAANPNVPTYNSGIAGTPYSSALVRLYREAAGFPLLPRMAP